MIPLEGVEPPGQALYGLQSPNMATPTSAALSTPLREEGAILDKGRARYLPSNPWQWFRGASSRSGDVPTNPLLWEYHVYHPLTCGTVSPFPESTPKNFSRTFIIGHFLEKRTNQKTYFYFR